MKDLTKIKNPFGHLGEKTQAALKAHGGPYLCKSAGGKWSDVSNPAFFPEISYRARPQPIINSITSETPVYTWLLRRSRLSIANSVTVGGTEDRPDMGGKIAGFTGGDLDEREVVLAYSTQEEINAAVLAWQKSKCGSDAPRIAALRAIMAERGCTAIQAMIHMERKDKHRALLPAGTKAAAIPSSETFRSKVIAALSYEWQNYKAFVGISPGASKGNVMETLRVLSRENRIECRKTSGLKGAEYRRLQVVA